MTLPFLSQSPNLVGSGPVGPPSSPVIGFPFSKGGYGVCNGSSGGASGLGLRSLIPTGVLG